MPITLIKLIQRLEAIDNKSTIYAAKPWTENSRALVLSEPESEELPPGAKKLGLKYFLGISIARDFPEDLAANLNTELTIQQKFARLLQHPIQDA
jgi:hypothetical protein